jgi:hypothetical protein
MMQAREQARSLQVKSLAMRVGDGGSAVSNLRLKPQGFLAK